MPIPTDAKGREELAQIVGKRLRAARRAAGVTQIQAANRLCQKGITQISLAEDGQRLPTLLDMLKYAELYAVPLDFLLGRIDDPIAEADEQSQGLVVRAVSHSIGGLFQKFTNAVAAHVSVTVSNHRQDRRDLLDAIQAAEEAEAALVRVRELNPEFDDLRNGARLESTLRRLSVIGKRAAARMKSEQAQMDMIDKTLELESIEENIKQFQFTFNTQPLENDACAVS